MNVYKLPERIYEVRTDESAVDVQIHRSAEPISAHATNIGNDICEGELIADDLVKFYDRIHGKLRKNAVRVKVAIPDLGDFYLVPFSDKLKKYTDKRVTTMFIPIDVLGRQIKVSVCVVKEDRLIYIASDKFNSYKKWLIDPEGIKLL